MNLRHNALLDATLDGSQKLVDDIAKDKKLAQYSKIENNVPQWRENMSPEEELEFERLFAIELKKMTTPQRYCITVDDSGHEYVIPVDQNDNWNTWLAHAIETDEWELPDYANRVEGNLTFEKPSW